MSMSKKASTILTLISIIVMTFIVIFIHGENVITKNHIPKTAVALETVIINNAYSKTYDNDMNEIINELKEPCIIRKNDIVVVLKQNSKYADVVIPYGNSPKVYAKVELKNLSFNKDLLTIANQAIIDNTTCYNMINGNAIGQKSGDIFIVKRHDSWVEVSFPGDNDNFWIKADNLKYNFDSQYVSSCD